MRISPRYALPLAVMALCCLAALPTQADFVNGGFEQGVVSGTSPAYALTGWSTGTYGDASGWITPGAPAQNPGNSLVAFDADAAYSGARGATVGATRTPVDALPAVNGPGHWYGASEDTGTHYGIYQSIELTEGAKIEFDYRTYRFDFGDPDSESAHFDFYLLTPDGAGARELSLLEVWGNDANNHNAMAADYANDSWQHFTHNVTAADLLALNIASGGWATAFLGVYADPLVDQGAMYANIDNARATPELGPCALLGMGMLPILGSGLRRRLRRRGA